jgi:hypothetical protein
LVPAPTFPLGVLHFPFRSFEQYRRRVEIAIENRQLTRGPVKEAYDAGRLEEVYRELAVDDETVARGVSEGWLVDDTRLRDFMASIADASDRGEPNLDPDAWPPERRGRGLEELELDGMYAIGRYLQAQAYNEERRRTDLARRRRTERRLRKRVRRLRARARRLRRIESSLWWRLRPRLPRRRRG